MEAQLAGGHLVSSMRQRGLEARRDCDPNPPGRFCWEGPDRDTIEEALADGRAHHPGQADGLRVRGRSLPGANNKNPAGSAAGVPLYTTLSSTAADRLWRALGSSDIRNSARWAPSAFPECAASLPPSRTAEKIASAENLSRGSKGPELVRISKSFSSRCQALNAWSSSETPRSIKARRIASSVVTLRQRAAKRSSAFGDPRQRHTFQRTDGYSSYMVVIGDAYGEEITTMRIRLIALLTALMLMVAMAAPALAAPGAKHGSCAGFGEAFAVWARGELPAELGHPGTVMPVLAQTAPGFAAQVLHAEMTMVVPDIPGTPFCESHPTQ